MKRLERLTFTLHLRWKLDNTTKEWSAASEELEADAAYVDYPEDDVEGATLYTKETFIKAVTKLLERDDLLTGVQH